ncbi:MAG: DUF1071 domain-containing protein [Firmicutes bacterium]|nr:DUF1071 domain-containing protein [Bacillota bacterium]
MPEAKIKKSVFETLNPVNCNEHTEKKGNLTYLSWAWAWAEVKKRYPLAFYTIYENADGRPYFDDGKTCWVKTGVTIEGLEHIEYLPIMDARNNSIPLERVTSFDMNKSIQRSLTKAAARHGLGLYIYAGEDLPEGADDAPAAPTPAQKEKVAPAAPQASKQAYDPMPKDKYMKYVRAQANGETFKGRQMLDVWREATNAGEEEVKQFLQDVASITLNDSI